jgi:hypothetical protein
MIENFYDVAEIAELIKIAVAPVFLLTGIGSFANVLSARIARIVDRARTLEEIITAGGPLTASQARLELKVQIRRLKLASWAVGLCVASALLICTLVALLFLGGLLHFDPSETLGILFVAAMCCLIVALILFFVEVQIAVQHTWLGSSMKRH